MFCEKGVLEISLRHATLLKKRLWHKYFPVNFEKLLTTPFFYRTHTVTASEHVQIQSGRSVDLV